MRVTSPFSRTKGSIQAPTGRNGSSPSREEGNNVQSPLILCNPLILSPRTVVVWLLLTYLVQSKIGVRCDSFDGFRDIPVPAPRALWEATTRPVWHAEYEIYKTMPRGGIDTLGDLMVCKQRDTRPDKLKLDAWNCTVDSLGILLNLAAPIL